MSRVGGQNSNSTRQLLKIRVWIYSVTHRPALIEEAGVGYSGKNQWCPHGFAPRGNRFGCKDGSSVPSLGQSVIPVPSLLSHTPSPLSPPGQCIGFAASAPSRIGTRGAEHLLSLGLAGCAAAGSWLQHIWPQTHDPLLTLPLQLPLGLAGTLSFLNCGFLMAFLDRCR